MYFLDNKFVCRNSILQKVEMITNTFPFFLGLIHEVFLHHCLHDVLRRLVDHLDAELDIGDGKVSMFDGGMLDGGMCDGIMYDGRLYSGSIYVVASMMVACTILACMMKACMMVVC